MKNQDVIDAWVACKPARTKSLSTDGWMLHSYRLKIGATVNGEKVAYDYRRKVSVTTSTHCGLAIEKADRVEDPPA